MGLSPQSELELSPFVQGSQTDLVKTEAVSAKPAKPRGAPNASPPGSPDRSLASVDLLWSQALDPKQESVQSLGCQASEISLAKRQSTRRTLDFGTLSPPKHDGDCVPAWLQQIHAVKRGPQNLATEAESKCKTGLQADEIPTPCRRAGSAGLNTNVRCQLMSAESDTESQSTMPASPAQEAPTALATCLGLGAPAPASVSTAKEGSPSASAASTAPATPSASPSPRAPVPEQTEVQASQCSEALEPLAAPVETMEVSAPSPGETPQEHTARVEDSSDRLSDTECRAEADVKEDGTGLSQFCFAKTTQEEDRAREVSRTGSPSFSAKGASASAPSAPAPDLSHFAFVETAGARAEAEATLSGSSPSGFSGPSVPGARRIPGSLSQELPKEVRRTAAKSRAKPRTKTSVPPHWQRPLPAELGGPVALTPGPATAPSPEALEKKGKQGRQADSEVAASMLEVRRGISDDDSDAPLATSIKRRRATAPGRLTPGKAPKAPKAKARAAAPSARPRTPASQANPESESKAPERSKKRAAPSRQEPSNKCRKAAGSKETPKPKALRTLKDTAFANPAEAAVAAANGRPVFATTGLELSTRQQKFLLDLQGLMVAEWNPHVSHLIADTFRRTTKMMCAICTGAHILSTEYVKACREAGRLVDEAAFVLKDTPWRQLFSVRARMARYCRGCRSTASHL